MADLQKVQPQKWHNPEVEIDEIVVKEKSLVLESM